VSCGFLRGSDKDDIAYCLLNLYMRIWVSRGRH